MQHSDYIIIETMRRYGGSFVSQLAEAALCADEANLQKIKATWPEYWTKYNDIATWTKTGGAEHGRRLEIR